MRKLVFLLFAMGFCACTQQQNKVPMITTSEATYIGQILSESVVKYPNIRFSGQETGLNGPIIDVYVPLETSKKTFPVLLYFKEKEIYIGENRLSLPTDSLVNKGIVVIEAPLDIDSDFQYELTVFKWVYENVNVFGGNINKLTIAGPVEGAGGVHQIMVSPLFAEKIAGVIGISGDNSIDQSWTSTAIDSIFTIGKQAQVPLMVHSPSADLAAGKWYELHSKTSAQPVFLFNGGFASDNEVVSKFSNMCANFIRNGNPNSETLLDWEPINGQEDPIIYSFK